MACYRNWFLLSLKSIFLLNVSKIKELRSARLWCLLVVLIHIQYQKVRTDSNKTRCSHTNCRNVHVAPSASLGNCLYLE
uniref:Uncharacterized protein n=1 Tax=Anguilla anguilla TaxID=7936 RepID=A0A0E9U566_ANGAN